MSINAKPIFLVQLPNSFSIKNEQLKSINDRLAEKQSDYHVLIIQTSVKDVEFTAFYDKDLIEVDFNNFKEMVMNQLKEKSNEN